jgi:hypothetical protein
MEAHRALYWLQRDENVLSHTSAHHPFLSNLPDLPHVDHDFKSYLPGGEGIM